MAYLEAAPSLFLFEARGLDDERAARFRTLWQSDALRAAHRGLAEDLDRSADAIGAMDLAAAAAETLRIGRAAIRRLMHDPPLPDELCPPAPPLNPGEEVQRYARTGA